MSESGAPAIETRRLSLWYGSFQALREVSVSIRQGIITSLIGPSGCGKTTLLRCFNRVNERYGGVRTSGEIRILGENVYAPEVSLIELRKVVGSQRIYDSVAELNKQEKALKAKLEDMEARGLDEAAQKEEFLAWCKEMNWNLRPNDRSLRPQRNSSPRGPKSELM